MKKYFLFFLFQICFSLSTAQTKTLNAEEYLQIVRKYHPVVKLAKINLQKSETDIISAKAAFDPIISTYRTKKTIDNSNYYNYDNSIIALPTWFGIDITAGIENLSGNRYDPSETQGQTSFIGISVPLLKNLITDKRRTFLRQARIYNEMAATEQEIVINDILKDAIVSYWEWVNAYQSYEIKQKNYNNSKKRFEFIKQIVTNGERPAIDTIEAFTQLQNIEFQKNEQWLEYQNKSLEISTFLWNENNNPYLLPENVTPQLGWENELNIQKFTLQLDELLRFANTLHPELKMYIQKNKILETEKKLKFQELLPKLNLSYNQINKGNDIFDAKNFMLDNNFQYNIKFEMPLFIRQGRAGYKQAKLKLIENEVQQKQKQQLIEQKVNSYYNQYINLKQQIALQSSMLQNYKKMLAAEETLFQNGEGSLFIINSRENKVLESENKLVEIKTKYFKNIYYLQWAAGILR